MLKLKNTTTNDKINIFFILLASLFFILSVAFGSITFLDYKKAEKISQIENSKLDALKSKLEKTSSLKPIEGNDTNVVKMLLKILGKSDDEVKVDITDTSSPQISKDGSIIYGSSKTDVTINVTVVIASGNLSFAKDLTVLIPKKAIKPTPTERSVSVRDYDAKGDGIADDTLKIQRAIDYISSVGGGTVNIPSGTYIINPDVSINMKSSIQLSLSSDAILKSSSSSKVNSEVINIIDVNNVNIIGGKIIGDRYIHTGTGGEWGMGVNIEKSSNVKISDINITNCWGDGIYIGGESSNGVVIDGVISDNNRRQGLSITNAKNVTITSSEFKNTNGTLPQAGIDLEPNPGQTVEDIKIDNIKSIGNKGSGVDILGMNGPVRRVKISNSVLQDNAGIGVMMSSANDIALTNDVIRNSTFGIEVKNDVYNVVASGLDISYNQSRGVSLVSNNQKVGIENILFKDTTVANNSQRSPGKADGVRIDAYDSTGYIKNVKFMNTKFIDNQKSHTQSFGLTVGNSKLISDITLYADCVFSGNISGGLHSAVPISQNVPR
ncbi:hypothetical protein CVV43_01225 [Candidatus Saccharibacteria bacterium HGW-Saccharibacteria-1]|jgi:hypothetical protein|nr:MAG: hypothetical protein CVV43_01225 [Candidatus Saccharibacteria bacterium HGW-Saccharibacteria-1]